jgi:hypothetical protein
MKMGLREYARHRGCHLKAVQRAIASGRITREADGKIESAQADCDWEKNTNHAMARCHKVGHRARITDMKATDAESALIELEGAAGDLNLGNGRIVKEIYKAKLLELEYDARVRSLVAKCDVEIAAFTRFHVLRDAIMDVPKRLAAQLAVENNVNAVHELLEQEFRMVLEQFASGRFG